MKIRNPLLLSIEDASNIGAPGGDTPAQTEQPSAPQSAPDSFASIINDVREAFAAPPVVAQEPAAPAVEQAPSAEPAPDQATAAAAPPIEPQPQEQSPQEEQLPAAPESRIAPLFQLGSLPSEEALPQAVELVRDMATYDPVHYNLLANAVLQASRAGIQNLVLQDLGVPRDKIAEFTTWVKSGAQALPAPAELPAFEQTVQQLDSTDGGKWVRLASGVEVDLNTPDGLERYENAKFRYEFEAEKKNAAIQATAAEQQKQAEAAETAALQAQQEIVSRAEFYESAQFAYADSLIKPILDALAPEDKFWGELLEARVDKMLRTHPDLKKVGQEAVQHVREGYGFKKDANGQWQMSGRIADLAVSQSRTIRTQINALKDQFNKELLRRNRAEIAATVTDPVLPPGTRTVQSNAPAQPGLGDLNSLEDIRRVAQEMDRQAQAAIR
jgi:hypothetical protein